MMKFSVFSASDFGDSCIKQILVEISVFLLEWSGSWAMWGSRHVALMVPSGCVMPELSELWCLVCSFKAGSMNLFSPWSLGVVVLSDSQLAAEWGNL
jgi:hypothetical protein